MTDQITPAVDTPSPTPAPTPDYSTWQLACMLCGHIWTGVSNLAKGVGGGTSSFLGSVEKFVKSSLIATISIAIIAGYVGGKTSQGSLPDFSWVLPWNWPSPTPHPPTPPTPPPSPAPIPAKGLHVLVVGDEAKMTAQQINALKSTEVRTYLNSVCPKGPDGKQAEYRFWPSTVDTTNESQLWKDAFKLTTGKTLPYIIVSNPDKGGGYEGPLPADQASLLALLKKYGG